MRGLLRRKADGTGWERYGSWSKTGAPQDPTLTVWAADLTLPLPGAFGFSEVVHSSYGSITTSSSVPDGTGRVFRNRIPAGQGSVGYRGHAELTSDADFPRYSTALTRYFRFTSLGGVQTTDTKLGYGLVGGPAGLTMDGTTLNRTYLTDTWSVRTTAVPRNYVNSNHPWCLASYIYAPYAGGRSHVDYGLRFFFRYPDGSYVIPSEGTWYLQREEIVVGTPGLRNGRYSVFIDGVRVLHLTDVMWARAGYDGPVRYLFSQTFGNNPIAAECVFDQSAALLER